MKFRHVFFLLPALLIVGSCKSSSEPSNNNAAAVGVEYFPITENQVIRGRVQTTMTLYDSAGVVIGTDNADNVGEVLIGSLQSLRGRTVLPIRAIDFNGRQVGGGSPVCYLGSLDSGIFGMNRYDADVATILPKEVSSGKNWIGETRSFPRYNVQANSEGVRDNYVNSAGQSYLNVLTVHAYYIDTMINSYYTHSETAEVRIYFAKGIGFVGGDIIKYDYTDYQMYNGAKYYFQHKTVTGTIGRNN